MKEILVLYYSRNGSVAALAEVIAESINRSPGVSARVRTVPAIDEQLLSSSGVAPADGPLFCSEQDLIDCDGLFLGSPTRVGNMAAPMKHFWDGTGSIWASGNLVDKPAAVFTSSNSMHGGNEATLLSMMIPLLHHGMLIMGVPYSCAQLNSTRQGGTPYGASHVESQDSDELHSDERAIAVFQAERMTRLLSAVATQM